MEECNKGGSSNLESLENSDRHDEGRGRVGQATTGADSERATRSVHVTASWILPLVSVSLAD